MTFYSQQCQDIESPTRPTQPRRPGQILPARYNVSRYQYNPLSDPKTQIRLFKILPSSQPGSLSCSITISSLPPAIPYNAISYQWQPETPYQSIQLNGHTHRIGYNLFIFLSKLAEVGETGYLWADALCIDQSNICERNAQVAVMSRIYHRADRVLCWVGKEGQGSRMLMQEMQGRNKMDWRTWILSEDGVEMWQALRAFCARDYWRRMWIIPEVLSRPQDQVVIFCGDDWVTLKRFHAVCDFALGVLRSERRRSSSWRKSFRLPPGWTKDDVAAMETDVGNSNTLHLSHKCGHTNLWDLLERHGNAGCSDPRDKVYALLSTAKDTKWSNCPLRPDYEKDVRVLITEVLTFCGRQDFESLKQLVGWILPGRKVPQTFEVWAAQWPSSIVA